MSVSNYLRELKRVQKRGAQIAQKRADLLQKRQQLEEEMEKNEQETKENALEEERILLQLRQDIDGRLQQRGQEEGQAVAAPPVDVMGGAGGPQGKQEPPEEGQGQLSVATGATPVQPPLGPINAVRSGSPSTAVASDTEDSEEENSEEEEGTDDDVVVVVMGDAGSGKGAVGGNGKRKATGRFQWSRQKGKTPTRAHAIVGMAYARGDPWKLWLAAVVEGWMKAFPDKPVPDALSVDEAADVDKITTLVQSMVPASALKHFTTDSLRALCANPLCHMFLSRDFMQLRLNYSSARQINEKNGLIHIFAKAIGESDYGTIIARENQVKWYKRPRLSL